MLDDSTFAAEDFLNVTEDAQTPSSDKPDISTFPPLAATRLPFHLFFEQDDQMSKLIMPILDVEMDVYNVVVCILVHRKYFIYIDTSKLQIRINYNS